MRLNLTQHLSTPEQGCVEPKDKGAVQALLTFEEIPTRKEIIDRAVELADIAVEHGASEAMIGGAPFFMRALEVALAAANVTPLYAFSRREVVEDGPKKTVVFRHIGFVRPA
jgi:hypothetical protein